MDEKILNEEFNEKNEINANDSELDFIAIENDAAVGDREWFYDDFEATIRNAVPKEKAISIYKPKVKKTRKFFKSSFFAAVISSILTCAICFGIFSFVVGNKVQTGGSSSVLPPATQMSSLKSVANTVQKGEMGIPEIYDAVSPSVVSILCKSEGSYWAESQTMSTGSGIIIRSDGYIVTNNHVIEGAANITVTTIAGQVFEAKVIGTDERTDLAVLKVETETPLVYAELGDSSAIRVGELAIAIGNPLREELAGTLTVGYISAINRTMVIDGKQLTMIQTDAAINPGNSGGALLNSYGQVIGINTAKSTGYDVEGLGFAIPINEARPIIESIIKNGYVTGRPLIGLMGRDITEAVAEANDLPMGVYVVEVTEYGAAERAGVRAGDIITQCEGKEIKTIDDINQIRDKHKPGDVITFKIDRNGEKLDIKVTLQEEKPSEKEEKKEKESQPTDPYSQYDYQIPSEFFPWFGW